MFAIRTSIIAALALREASAECSEWCPYLLPDQCHQNVSDGGCCREDGFRETEGACSSCTPQGNSYDWMCSLCNKDSKCNAMNRAQADEPQCEAAGCRGGCMMNGECNHSITQEACALERKTWCPACTIDVWVYCGPWADCYAMCTGCCATTDGRCPEAPFHMREDGPCSACAPRPEMCEACFPESICSVEYDSTKYNFTVTQRFENFVHPDDAAAAETEETATTTASPTAELTQTTTAAATNTTTFAPTNFSTDVQSTSVPQDEETMSCGNRMVARLFILSVFAPCLRVV